MLGENFGHSRKKNALFHAKHLTFVAPQIPLSAATRTKKLKHKEDRHAYLCVYVVDLSGITRFASLASLTMSV
jgi:hypothetical protein